MSVCYDSILELKSGEVMCKTGGGGLKENINNTGEDPFLKEKLSCCHRKISINTTVIRESTELSLSINNQGV